MSGRCWLGGKRGPSFKVLLWVVGGRWWEAARALAPLKTAGKAVNKAWRLRLQQRCRHARWSCRLDGCGGRGAGFSGRGGEWGWCVGEEGGGFFGAASRRVGWVVTA